MDNIVKKLYNQLVTNVSATDTKIPSFSRPITETQYDSNKHGFEEKKLRMSVKRYLTLVGRSRRLAITQKLQRWKTRYLVLLD